MGAVQAPLARATHSVPLRGGAGEPAPSRVGCSACPAHTPHAGAVPHLARLARPGPRRVGTSCPRSGVRTGPGARCGCRVARALRTGTRASVAPAASLPDARTGRPATAPWSSWERRSPCRRHSQACGSVAPRTSLAPAGPPSAQRRAGRPGTTPSPPQTHRRSPGLGSPMCPVPSSEPPPDGAVSRQRHPPSAAAAHSHASAWVPAGPSMERPAIRDRTRCGRWPGRHIREMHPRRTRQAVFGFALRALATRVCRHRASTAPAGTTSFSDASTSAPACNVSWRSDQWRRWPRRPGAGPVLAQPISPPPRGGSWKDQVQPCRADGKRSSGRIPIPQRVVRRPRRAPSP